MYELGVTEQDVCDAMGCHVGYINRIKNGRLVPMVRNALLLAAVLETTLDGLWPGLPRIERTAREVRATRIDRRRRAA